MHNKRGRPQSEEKRHKKIEIKLTDGEFESLEKISGRFEYKTNAHFIRDLVFGYDECKAIYEDLLELPVIETFFKQCEVYKKTHEKLHAAVHEVMEAYEPVKRASDETEFFKGQQ